MIHDNNDYTFCFLVKMHDNLKQKFGRSGLDRGAGSTLKRRGQLLQKGHILNNYKNY